MANIGSTFSFQKFLKNSNIMRRILCLPKKTDIAANKDSTSNLGKHIVVSLT